MSSENDVSSRLGEPAAVADAAVYAFRRRTFLGRHPLAALLVFGLTPLPSLLLLLVLAFGCMYGFFSACEWLGLNLNVKRFDPAASIVLPYVFSLTMVAIPAALASLFYCKLIQRLGLSKRWLILACVVLAFLAILPIWSVSLSDQPGKSALQCGIGFPANFIHTYFASLQQWLQFLTPLLVGLHFLRRSRPQIQNEEPMRLAA